MGEHYGFIKFEFIENIITSTSLKDDYYFTLFDSQNKISANPDKNLVDTTLEDAYKQSGWASISFEELTKELNEGKTGDYAGELIITAEYVQQHAGGRKFLEIGHAY